jgi:hypothetical protein
MQGRAVARRWEWKFADRRLGLIVQRNAPGSAEITAGDVGRMHNAMREDRQPVLQGHEPGDYQPGASI